MSHIVYVLNGPNLNLLGKRQQRLSMYHNQRPFSCGAGHQCYAGGRPICVGGKANGLLYC